MIESAAKRVEIKEAVEHLRVGGFIAYPTETVWGLGACADQPDAIARLMDWKGRRDDMPLAVLAASPASLDALGCRVDDRAMALIAAFWPGPLMLVLPCDRGFAPGVAGERGALGVRCSPHPVSAALAVALEAAGLGPLTSTSLNRTGDPPARDLEMARAVAPEAGGRDHPLRVEASGMDAGGEIPSTVVDCTGQPLRVLRAGAIPADRIQAVLAT